jgi:DNA-binding HxlR family transcriptional regulator
LFFRTSTGTVGGMARFRYSQLCALARAAEVVGERWTLLIVRELLPGSRRFTDLRARLDGVSASVLSQRLLALEESGLVLRRYLEPPAASTVYELTEAGRALEPAVHALVRWGVRALLPVRGRERVESDWLRLALTAYARREPTPARSFTLRVRQPRRDVAVRVAGGADGTTVSEAGAPSDATLTGDPQTMLGLVSGMLVPAAAVRAGQVRLEGDAGALDDFAALFNVER